MSNRSWILGLILAAACGTLPAQQYGPLGMIKGVGIDQNLNAQVPMNLMFTDETGQPVRLGQYFRGKPVLLTLVYYTCPGLCDLVLNGVTHSMEQISLNLGSDFDVVTVSFNPADTWQLAAAKKGNYVEKYNRKGAQEGWHFLTGKPDAIKAITDAVGFHYKYDPSTQQFAHASGIMLLTPEGKLSSYFYGIEYKPRDLRLGLVEASKNTIGSPVDEVLLLCFHYDPATGKYGLIIQNVMRGLASVAVLALLGFIFFMLRRDRRSNSAHAERLA